MAAVMAQEAAAQTAPSRVRVVDVERGHEFGGGAGIRVVPPQRDWVVVVVSVRGIRDDQWNRMPLSFFTLSDGTGT